MQTVGILDQVLQTFHTQAGAWQTALTGMALHLFWLLVAIDFAFMAIRLVFRGADFSEWIGELVQQILFIGLFLFLLTHSAQIAGDIVDSLRQAANQASIAAGGSSNMSPADILGIGVNIAAAVIRKTSWWHLGATAGLVVAGLVVLVCFALITAYVVLALVESYVVISAGVLFMGFGGSRWTKDIAVTIIRYALSVGAKLFVMQLLVGLGEAMMRGWVQQYDKLTLEPLCVVIGCAIVFAALVMTVPSMVQGLMNGTSVGSGSALIAAAGMVGGGAAGAAIGLAGSGAAVTGAAKLAMTQTAARPEPPTSRLGRMASLTGGTVKNLGSAAATDVGRRLSGHAHHGHSPWRMAADLNNRHRLVAEEGDRPKPPPVPGAARVGPEP